MSNAEVLILATEYGSLYYTSFRSSLHSHLLWKTLYKISWHLL